MNASVAPLVSGLVSSLVSGVCYAVLHIKEEEIVNEKAESILGSVRHPAQQEGCLHGSGIGRPGSGRRSAKWSWRRTRRRAVFYLLDLLGNALLGVSYTGCSGEYPTQ